MKPGGSLRLAAATLALTSVTIAPGDPGSAGILIDVSPVKFEIDLFHVICWAIYVVCCCYLSDVLLYSIDMKRQHFLFSFFFLLSLF